LACIDGYYHISYVPGEGCRKLSDTPDFIGLEVLSTTFKPCTVPNCRRCAEDNTICTKCDESNAYTLTNGLCQSTSIDFVLTPFSAQSKYPREPYNYVEIRIVPSGGNLGGDGYLRNLVEVYGGDVVVEGYLVSTDGSIIYPSLPLNFSTSVQQNSILISTNVPFQPKTSQSPNSPLFLNYTLYETHPLKVAFTVNISSRFNLVNGQYYRRGKYSGRVDVDIYSGEDREYWMGGKVGGYWARVLNICLLYFDITGTWYRLSRALESITRGYYINVPTGRRLGGLLWQLNYEYTEDNYSQICTTYGCKGRGKLDTAHLPHLPLSTLWPLILIYSLSWIFKLVRVLAYWSPQRNQRSTWWIWICYYHDKIHFVVYCFMYSDMVFVLPRGLAHLASTPWPTIIFSLLTLSLLSLDTLSVLISTLSSISLHAYLHRQSLCTLRGNTDNNNNNTMDYDRIYTEIDNNYPMIRIIYAGCGNGAEGIGIGRVIIAGAWIRPIVVSACIGACQTASTFGIVLMLLFELLLIIGNTLLYIKHRHLKNIICLLIEVLPAFALFLFYFLCLILSTKSFTAPISPFLQGFGIFTILLCILSVFSLLFAQIILLSYNKILLTKYLLKNNLIKENWMKIYYKKPISEQKNEEIANFNENAQIDENERNLSDLAVVVDNSAENYRGNDDSRADLRLGDDGGGVEDGQNRISAFSDGKSGQNSQFGQSVDGRVQSFNYSSIAFQKDSSVQRKGSNDNRSVAADNNSLY